MSAPPLSPTFRPYEAADREACLALFDQNCPEFFAPNERAEYLAFLAEHSEGYDVCVAGDEVAGAYGLQPDGSGALAIRWMLIGSSMQGRGLGSAMMRRALKDARDRGAPRMVMAASHRSAPFFARFGAVERVTVPHGWGPDMHRVDMDLAL